ncbi:L,D-transpeptidase [Aestuariivirga sp.]|uniref:L,D-transpeptidase n=1 Tax=Aestuariivirga sp. TaxID=2650926 RepID=UPI0039E58C43
MMKRILMAAALGLAVSMTAAAPAVSATTSQEEAILLKKKKALAAKLAAEKALRDADAEAAALKKAKAAKAADASGKRKPSVRIQPVVDTSAGSPRVCTGFFKCLFGKRDARVTRNGVFQTASFSASGGKAVKLSNKTTREVVDWNETKYPVGSIIVKTPERALYYVSGEGEAIRYAVGVGKEGMQWSGQSSIVRKAEWPSWTPPKQMIEREAAKGHYIPDFMEGGPGNPLGARAMYIGGSIYRVHGTNNEASIGGAVSSGCIRMMNADVMDLYERVKIGAKIYVYQ